MGTHESSMGEAVGPTALDDVFRALSNATRRELLGHLVAREESVRFGTLVERLSTAVDDCDDSDCSRNRIDIAVALHHTHLPLLESSRLVDVDGDREFVSSTGRLRQFEPLIHHVRGMES